MIIEFNLTVLILFIYMYTFFRGLYVFINNKKVSISNEITNFQLYLSILFIIYATLFPIRLDVAFEGFEIYNLICDYYNYERFCINGLTGINNDFIDFGSNIKALYVKSRMNAENPKKCYVFGHIHHPLDGKDTAEGFYRQAKQLYEMGVDGYKFIEGKPGFRKDTGYAIDDPIYDKMYEFIQSTGLPVLHHIADPAKCWDITKATPVMIQRGWVYDETYRTLPQLREESDGLLRKFPII